MARIFYGQKGYQYHNEYPAHWDEPDRSDYEDTIQSIADNFFDSGRAGNEKWATKCGEFVDEMLMEIEIYHHYQDEISFPPSFIAQIINEDWKEKCYQAAEEYFMSGEYGSDIEDGNHDYQTASEAAYQDCYF